MKMMHAIKMSRAPLNFAMTWTRNHYKPYRSITQSDSSINLFATRNQHTKPKCSRISGGDFFQKHISMREKSFSEIHIIQESKLYSIPESVQTLKAEENETIIGEFNNHKYAHSSKSISELIRAIIVFHICQMKILIKNAESAVNLSKKMFGAKFTSMVMKQTFFKHFCGGEDEESVQFTVDNLKTYGIGSILDYAVEDDMKTIDDSMVHDFKKDNLSTFKSKSFHTKIKQDFKSEDMYDSHMNNFLSCIRMSRNVSNSDSDKGIAALKLTALGNPLLLERMSVAINEAKIVFAKFDHDRDGIVTRHEFKQAYKLFFNDSDETLSRVIDALDHEGNNRIDYISWSQLLKPTDLFRIAPSCRSFGALALEALSMKDIELMEMMRERATKIANEAFNSKIRLLIDAEQSQIQPAINSIVLGLQQEFNCTTKTEFPIIFNTYQCYLKDTHERLAVDLEISRRFRYHFAAKLVRGAYMDSERKRAEKLKIPSPIHKSIDETHKCFNDVFEFLIRHKIKTNSNLEILCATHNQYSIERAIELMHDLNIQPSDSTVSFAQLYGMKDSITYPLGCYGFRAYKYLPYGPVGEVMPYLIRRAQENGDIFGNSSYELTFLYDELNKRIKLSL